MVKGIQTTFIFRAKVSLDLVYCTKLVIADSEFSVAYASINEIRKISE